MEPHFSPTSLVFKFDVRMAKTYDDDRCRANVTTYLTSFWEQSFVRLQLSNASFCRVSRAPAHVFVRYVLIEEPAIPEGRIMVFAVYDIKVQTASAQEHLVERVRKLGSIDFVRVGKGLAFVLVMGSFMLGDGEPDSLVAIGLVPRDDIPNLTKTTFCKSSVFPGQLLWQMVNCDLMLEYGYCVRGIDVADGVPFAVVTKPKGEVYNREVGACMSESLDKCLRKYTGSDDKFVTGIVLPDSLL